MLGYDFSRLKRLMIAYRVVQVILLLILAVAVFLFQTNYPHQFLSGVVASVVLQLLLFYPIYRLALRDVTVEIDGSAIELSTEDKAALRKKRLMGDLWKVSVLVFYLIFIARVPDVKKTGTPFFLSVSLYSCLLLFLTYFQCFNFGAKKRIATQ